MGSITHTHSYELSWHRRFDSQMELVKGEDNHIIGYSKGEVHVWEAAGAREVKSIKTDFSISAVYGPRNSYIYVGTHSGNIQSYNTADDLCEVFPLEHKAKINVIRRVGGAIISGDSRGKMCLWEEGAILIRTLKSKSPVLAITDIDSECCFASGHEDSKVRIWSQMKGLIRVINGDGGPVRSLVEHAGRYLAASGRGDMRQWYGETFEVATATPKIASGELVQVGANSFALPCTDGEVRMWEWGERKWSVAPAAALHKSPVRGVIPVSGGFASTAVEGVVYIYDVTNRKIKQVIIPSGDAPASTVLPDGDSAFSLGRTENKVWSLKGCCLTPMSLADDLHFEIWPEGKSGSGSISASFARTETGERATPLYTSAIVSMVACESGFVLSTTDGRVQMWKASESGAGGSK